MIKRVLCRLTGAKDDEIGIALSSCALFFLILCGYYILRPLREEMGLAGGVRNLPYLYLINLGVMFVLAPVFGWVATRWSRRHFVPGIYLFFMSNMVVFFVLMKTLPPSNGLLLGRIFYVWVSVYNMWAVSLFWAFMADGFALERGKRLFGIVAMGGSAGATLGSWLTRSFVDEIGRTNLILISAGFMLAAAVLIFALSRSFGRKLALDCSSEPGHGQHLRTPAANTRAAGSAAGPMSGTMAGSLRGVTDFFRSRYLLAIGAYLFLFTLSSTFLYFEQAEIVDAAASTRAAKTQIFANIDLWVNMLTFVTQLFFTGRLIRHLGVGGVLMILPVLTVLGFTALGATPVLAVLVVFQVLRRAGNYALARPARETLFTIVNLDQKYKAKSFIDTFVYRGGDALGAAVFKLLGTVGLGLGAIAFVAVPPAILWAFVGVYLGRKQQALAGTAPTTARSLAGDSPPVRSL